MRDGVRIVNCARGELVDLDALLARARVRQGRRRRARRLPVGAVHRAPAVRARRRRRHPAPRAPRPPRRRTGPGSSPPSRSRAALTGGVVTNAVNIAAVRPEAMEALAPFVPLCEKLGRLAQGLGDGADRPGRGRLPRPDRRARHAPARDRGPGRDPLRAHRGAGQPRQRPGDGRGARDRADRAQGGGLGGLHRADHGPPRRASRSPAPASGRATSPTWSASGARASTCRSPTTWRSSATPTSPG